MHIFFMVKSKTFGLVMEGKCTFLSNWLVQRFVSAPQLGKNLFLCLSLIVINRDSLCLIFHQLNRYLYKKQGPNQKNCGSGD